MNTDFFKMFDEGVERSGTQCGKWDNREKVFGRADVVPMWVADSDWAAPKEVSEALAKKAAQGAFGYSSADGSDRAAAVNWLRNHHGVENAEMDWLLYSPGVVDALYLAILALTEPGDLVAIQPPVYGPFTMVTKKSGRALYENHLILGEDGIWRMDLADLEEGLKKGVKLLLLCSPHNPTGRVWTREELTDLVALLNRYGAHLVSDEIHGDLVMPGYKQVPICSLPGAERAVMTMAPSKTFNLAGLQHAFYVVRDEQIREKVKKVISSSGIDHGNIFGEAACVAAYTYGEEWLAAQNAYLAENRAFLEEFFAENMPEVRVTKGQGTYLGWVDFTAWGLDEKALSALLVKHGVGFSAGTSFGPRNEGWMRVNLATPRRNVEAGLRCVLEARKEIFG